MSRIVLWAWMSSVIAAQCSFPDELLGNWTSSNYGVLTFSHTSPQFVMSFGALAGTSSTSFDCYLIARTQYILKSLATITVFAGTPDVYAYLCLDLRASGPYSYYYYQNSATEDGFFGERMVGINEVISDVKVYNVCTTTLDVAEFHTMVKVGFESEAVIQCADPLLLSGIYTYTDSTGTFCSGLNTALVDSCNNNLTTLQFNDSLVNDSNCAALKPGWSANGYLGCVANVYDQNKTHYVSLLNFDEMVDDLATFRYTCVAVISDSNGTVSLSMSPKDCSAGQNATDMPTGGAVMEISPFRVPMEPAKDWTWLIILCICLFVLILVIALAFLVCRYMAQRKKRKAREKNMLTDKHPMAEISMRLDAPATLEKLPDANLLEVRDKTLSSPRGHMTENPMKNPMPEPSLLLDFKHSKWSIVKDKISTIIEDPFSEISKDEVVSVKPSRNRRTKTFWNFGKRPFVSLSRKSTSPKQLPNAGLPNRNKVTNGTFVINRSKTQYVQTEKPKNERANSLHAEGTSFKRGEAQTQTIADYGSKEIKGLPNIQATQILTESNIKEESGFSKDLKVEKSPSVSDSSNKNKTIAQKAPSFHNERGIRTNSRRSLITWTGKRLNRSQSNVGARLTRGLTSTRLGSVTKGKSNTKKEKLQRSQSVPDTPPGTQQHSAGTLQRNEGKDVIAEKEFVTTETCEPPSEMTAINNNLSVSQSGSQTKIIQNTQFQESQRAASILPEITNITSITPPVPEETNNWDDYVDNTVNDWLQTKEKQTDTVDLNASFSGTYTSFLNIKSKTDITKKTMRPTASKTPWR